MPPSDDELWTAVSEVLAARAGWAIEASSTPGAPPAWCFGSGGEVDLTVSAEEGAITAYIEASDREVRFADVDALTTWLDTNERALLGHPLEPGEVVDDIVHGRITHWGEPGT